MSLFVEALKCLEAIFYFWTQIFRSYDYQHPPTGHQLRPVRVQQPLTNSLARRVLVYDSYVHR